jgi:hypothetical protein
MRVDKKSLPPAWIAIHRSTAERSRGRPLTRKELRELKEGLERSLLVKVLPSVRLIDALYVPKKARVLVFASGKSVLEEFAKLFHATFDALLVAMTPRTLAQALPLGAERHRYLDEVSPVAWHRSGGAAPAALPEGVRARMAAEEPVDRGTDSAAASDGVEEQATTGGEA